MKIIKSFMITAIAVITLFSVCSQASALERQTESVAVNSGSITFSGLSQLVEGEQVEHCITSIDGSKAIVGLEKVRQVTRAGGETWRVWYSGINHKAEFYMTVSNNKVTSVYDYSISLFGGSYEDAELTKTSTYGKLTYTAKSLGGILTGTCWLKGTVTGSNDEIDVTWQM